MLEKLKGLFVKEMALTNTAAILNFVHQLAKFFEEHVKDESARNVAIDAVIELLHQEKK